MKAPVRTATKEKSASQSSRDFGLVAFGAHSTKPSAFYTPREEAIIYFLQDLANFD